MDGAGVGSGLGVGVGVGVGVGMGREGIEAFTQTVFDPSVYVRYPILVVGTVMSAAVKIVPIKLIYV